MTKMPEKLIIIATNLLIYHLIVKVDYANLFLISKLIVLGIEFEIPKETSFANDSSAKPEKQIKLGHWVLR